MNFPLPIGSILLTFAIFTCGLLSAYLAGKYADSRKPEARTLLQRWQWICRSTDIGEVIFASLSLLWGVYLTTGAHATDPVTAAMKQVAPIGYWSFTLILVGLAQCYCVLFNRPAARIFCCMVEVWVFGFISISLIWVHAWVPGVVLVPTYAVWCGYFGALLQRELPRYGRTGIE